MGTEIRSIYDISVAVDTTTITTKEVGPSCKNKAKPKGLNLFHKKASSFRGTGLAIGGHSITCAGLEREKSNSVRTSRAYIHS